MDVSSLTANSAAQESPKTSLLGGRLSISELAQTIGCSERYIYNMISRGMPFVKLAGKRYVRPEDFQAMLDRMERKEAGGLRQRAALSSR